MKLNNKGFAVSTFMYMILVLAIILILATLAILSSRKMILDRQKATALDNIKISQKEAGIGKPYIGYYADVDGDGNADGVIYADLAHKKEETTWGTNNPQYSKYSYEAKTNLNEYKISQNNAEETRYGINKIITLKTNNNNPRFYVMALNDFTSHEWYYWYYNVKNEGMATWETDTSRNFGAGYANTGTIIDIWNDGENGKYNAAQNNLDIWKYIQEEYQEGWYIPSLGEWVAFADYLEHKKDNPLTVSNYNTIYGLSTGYWSSSPASKYNAWVLNFNGKSISSPSVDTGIKIRLGATF